MQTVKNRKNIHKKAIILGVALLGSLCISCGKKKENKLNIYMSDYQQNYYKDAIEDYKDAYPDVELEISSYSMTEPLSTTQKVKTQMMAGEGPDLLLFSSLGIDDVNKFMAAGAFAPLDEYMSADEEWDDAKYVSEVMKGGQFNDKQYVMPFNYSVAVILSSKEALEEAGFDVAACTDMLPLLQEISSLYETDYKQQILADCSMFVFFPQQLKSGFVDYATGELEADREELKAACDAYRNIFEEDNTASSLLEHGYYSQGTAILDRSAYITSSSILVGMLQPMAAISAEETPIFIPISKGDGKPMAQIHEYAGIRANSENKENAWNMMRFLMREDVQIKMSSAIGYVPVLKSAIDAQVDDKLAEAVNEGEKNGVETAQISNELKELYLDYLKNPGSAMFYNELSRKFIERMLPYLRDESEYEDCLKDFENYAKIYLTE